MQTDTIAHKKKKTGPATPVFADHVRYIRVLTYWTRRQLWGLLPSSSLESHRFESTLLPLLEPLPQLVPFRLGRPSLAAHVQMDGWPLSSASRLHAQGYSTHRTILKNSYLLSSPILSTLDYLQWWQAAPTHVSFPNCSLPAGRICVQTGQGEGWGRRLGTLVASVI